MSLSLTRYCRNLAVCIALLAFALRSMIPTGFMPDYSGHNLLVICDGIHHPPEHKQNPANKRNAASPCPFSIGAVFSFGETEPPPVTIPAYSSPFLPTLTAATATKSTIFGNASPRSPPAAS